MSIIHLTIAGLCWQLDSDTALAVAPRMKPFLSAATAADISIRIRSVTALPTLPEGGFFDGMRYIHHGDIWYVSQVGEPPYAHAHHHEDGTIELCHLPTAAAAFGGTGGVFNHIDMEDPLLTHGGVMLHASLVRYQGKAIAFCAPSGTGKSTQAALWQETLGADILNGDRTAVRHAEGEWVAYGLPFAGTSGIYRQEQAPLSAVVMLGQAPENTIRRMAATEALLSLYPQSARPHRSQHLTERAMDTLAALIAAVPVYRLDCRPDTEAVTLLRHTLTQGGVL